MTPRGRGVNEKCVDKSEKTYPHKCKTYGGFRDLVVSSAPSTQHPHRKCNAWFRHHKQNRNATRSFRTVRVTPHPRDLPNTPQVRSQSTPATVGGVFRKRRTPLSLGYAYLLLEVVFRVAVEVYELVLKTPNSLRLPNRNKNTADRRVKTFAL